MSRPALIIISDTTERNELIQARLSNEPFQIILCTDLAHLSKHRAQMDHTDVVLLNFENPHHKMINYCAEMFDLPLVLFSSRVSQATIQFALNNGITNVIEGNINPKTLNSIIEVSVAHFKQHKALVDALNSATGKLADRKDIEKAKQMLINTHQLSEDQAFQRLRKNAMSHRMTMGEMARKLLAAKDTLKDFAD